MNLKITGLNGVTEESVQSVDAIVSILDHAQPVPIEVAQSGARRLILRFGDFEDSHRHGPRRKHVRELIAFAEQTSRSDRVLVHCYAGISRSTAAAAIILARLRDDGDYDAIFELIGKLRKLAWPNLRLMQLADRELRAKGALLEALERFYEMQFAANPYASTEAYRRTKFRTGGGSAEEQ
jgi:predicted protein tyrosine phosphatase